MIKHDATLVEITLSDYRSRVSGLLGRDGAGGVQAGEYSKRLAVQGLYRPEHCRVELVLHAFGHSRLAKRTHSGLARRARAFVEADGAYLDDADFLRWVYGAQFLGLSGQFRCELVGSECFPDALATLHAPALLEIA